ncbi:MAG: hypothetical protein WBP41_07550 [Saprospiraceae bacterium]
MDSFKLDRTHFQILSFEQVDKELNDHSSMDWKERLLLHQYLNSIAYGYLNQEIPRLDRTVFQARKFSDEDQDDILHL